MTRLKLLKSALEKTPNDPFLWFAIAQELTKANQEEEALKWYKRLVKEHPDYVGTYYHYAGLLFAQGKQAISLQIIDAGLAACARNGDGHAQSELLNLKNQIDE